MLAEDKNTGSSALETDFNSSQAKQCFKEHQEKGYYCCAQCSTEVFSSADKFHNKKSPCASFKKALSSVCVEEDYSYGVKRKIAKCKTCGLVLGSVFVSGKEERFSISSQSLKFGEGEVVESRSSSSNRTTIIVGIGGVLLVGLLAYFIYKKKDEKN